MNRRVITPGYFNSTAAGSNMTATGTVQVPPLDTYYDRLIKYIPADVVAGWITVKGIISSASDANTDKVYWICFIAGVIFTILWTYKLTYVKGSKPAYTQIIIATIAFLIWVLATGKPFDIEPYIGSLILIGYTIGAGLIIPGE
jgi:drug/metabolite transporter (DMT)-like permease